MITRWGMFHGVAFLVAALSALALAGCAGKEPPPATAPAGPPVSAAGAWVRATPGQGAGQMTAAYLTLRSAGTQAERLIGARAEGAGAVEIHQTTRQGEVMRMAPVDGVDLPAGGTVALEPGGLHLMLLDLAGPLAPGDVVALTLVFESGLELPVQAEVRPLGSE